MKHRTITTIILAAVALASFGCGSFEPRSAEAGDELCGTGTIVDLAVRTQPETKELIYTVTFRVNNMMYTAEALGGRIALFGPIAENAHIDLCVMGKQLTLVSPSDEDPEVVSYTMNVIRISRVPGPNSTS